MMDRPEYNGFYKAFDVNAFAGTLQGDLEGGLNACVECCDRHVGRNAVALNWKGASGQSAAYTFEYLQSQSAKVANLLVAHGVQPGDRVSGLLPRIPDLVSLILGVWRAGAVYQPLFTAFGPKAIEHRLTTSRAKVVVTDPANRPKLDDIANLPIVMCTESGGKGDIDFTAEVAAQSDSFAPVMRKGADAFLLMSTSGTTGLPKGMNIPLRALVGMAGYMKLALDVQPDDVFWNIADPGWAYGLYYAITGPLLLGHQTTFNEGPFTVESTAALVRELGITNFAGAPTAYRMIMAEGPDAVKPLTGKIRVASSAGEPLNPEVMRWFKQHIGCDLFDQYGQTETGMVLANHHGLRHDVLPGSAGFQMPGFTLEVVNEAGEPVPQGTQGILAVHRPTSPLFFFGGYLGAEGQGWVGDYYLTGDTVEQNENGSISFVGRSDDVISSAGYRIGPFDVESSLLEHDKVVESAVIGTPDTERGEIVKAFVVLKSGVQGDEALAEELKQLVRNRLGKHAFPREIVFVESLPKTPSGKIQRFILRKE
ncbi:MAG: AMP-binding protein [Sneathiella sp.]|nr:AMP-binding protein [Sneathiella sp.]